VKRSSINIIRSKCRFSIISKEEEEGHFTYAKRKIDEITKKKKVESNVHEVDDSIESV